MKTNDSIAATDVPGGHSCVRRNLDWTPAYAGVTITLWRDPKILPASSLDA